MMKSSKRLSLEDLEYLKSTLDRVVSFSEHLDTHISVLIGFSSAIFLFSLSQISSRLNLVYLVMAIFSAAASIIAIFAIRPFRSMRKRGQAESILYRKNIVGFDDPRTFARMLPRVIDDRKYGYQQFGIEIYNMLKYYYQPKKYLFYLARKVFLLGLCLSLVILLGYLIYAV